MKKSIRTLLIGFFIFNLSLNSFASDDKKTPEGTNQKAGEKIIITESVGPAKKVEEAPVENKDEVKPENKAENQNPERLEKEDQVDVKKDRPTEEEKEEASTEDKKKTSEKDTGPDIEKIEKVVDDLVLKLDKNSDLARALSELNTNTDKNQGGKKKTSSVSKEISKETEKVLKDYNEKVQTAKTESQRRQLEEETADKINTLNNKGHVKKSKSQKSGESREETPIKKKKILLEVKPDENEDEEDRNLIYALNPDKDEEEERGMFFKSPFLILGIVLVILILVVIGFLIRKNDIREK